MLTLFSSTLWLGPGVGPDGVPDVLLPLVDPVPDREAPTEGVDVEEEPAAEVAGVGPPSPDATS